MLLGADDFIKYPFTSEEVFDGHHFFSRLRFILYRSESMEALIKTKHATNLNELDVLLKTNYNNIRHPFKSSLAIISLMMHDPWAGQTVDP